MATPKATKKSSKPKAPKQPGLPVTVKDISAASFIAAYAAHLKKTNWIKLPAWVDLVKTGKAKELAPLDVDWYYVRAGTPSLDYQISSFLASVARKIYLRGNVGVQKLTIVYGGNKRRGPRPERFSHASSAVLRHVVKQLESIGVVEKNPSTKG